MAGNLIKRGLKKMVSKWMIESGWSASGHVFDHVFSRLSDLRDLGFEPSAICDIGASNGRWSKACMGIYPKAEYFCIDPLAENEAELLKFSQQYDNVKYWLGCLGAEPGEAVLNADGPGSSILSGHFGNRYGSQRKVEVQTLDNLVGQGMCPQPDLIKLDVQGYELEVLKGAAAVLARTQAIIAEVSFLSFQTGMPIFHEVVGKMADYGFLTHDILGLSGRPLDGATAQADVLFVKATNELRSSNRWDTESVY